VLCTRQTLLLLKDLKLIDTYTDWGLTFRCALQALGQDGAARQAGARKRGERHAAASGERPLRRPLLGALWSNTQV